MPFQFTELGSCDDVHLLLRLRFEVSVANVGLPQLEIIVLCQEDDDAYATKRDDTRVHAFDRSVSEMTAGNDS